MKTRNAADANEGTKLRQRGKGGQMARQRWETESHKRQSGSARLAQEGILSFLSPLWLGSLEEVVPRPVDWGYITASGFGTKEIRNCGLVYARNASLRKRRNGGTAVALIPFVQELWSKIPGAGSSSAALNSSSLKYFLRVSMSSSEA